MSERTDNLRTEWQPISTAPEGIVVDTKVDDEHGARNEQPMKRDGRLWWLPDGSMYVYFTPTHWRPLSKETTT
jgi:hypothetical protein